MRICNSAIVLHVNVFTVAGKLRCEVILFLLILTTYGKQQLSIAKAYLWHNLCICIEDSTNAISIVNINDSQDACLLENVTFNCILPTEVTNDTQWTVYPLNMTITSTETSDTTCNCSISETLYAVTKLQEAIYLLVTANSTPVCNISLSFDKLLKKIDRYRKSMLLCKL